MTRVRHRCLEYHVGKATESGIDAEEIAHAIEVGKMVRKGATGKMDKLVENLRRASPSPAGASTACCG